jgi:hypothetical protein
MWESSGEMEREYSTLDSGKEKKIEKRTVAELITNLAIEDPQNWSART